MLLRMIFLRSNLKNLQASAKVGGSALWTLNFFWSCQNAASQIIFKPLLLWVQHFSSSSSSLIVFFTCAAVINFWALTVLNTDSSKRTVINFYSSLQSADRVTWFSKECFNVSLTKQSVPSSLNVSNIIFSLVFNLLLTSMFFSSSSFFTILSSYLSNLLIMPVTIVTGPHTNSVTWD